MLQDRLEELALSRILGCFSFILGGSGFIWGLFFLAYRLPPSAAGDETWRAQMCIPSIPQQGS